MRLPWATAAALTVGVAGCTRQTAATADPDAVEKIVQKAIAQVGGTDVFGVEAG